MGLPSRSATLVAALTLPRGQWPVSDQQLWQAAQQPASPFRPQNIAYTWSPESRHLRETAYGRWLAWLERNDSLNPALKPSERVTVDRIAGYIEQLQRRVSPVTTATQIGALLYMLRALEPKADLAWLRPVYQHLKCTARPSRDKRSAMVPAKDLYDLGISLMDAVAASPDHGYFARITYRDGLIISVLAAAPVRLGTLSAIEIGRHLTYRDGVYWLEFTPKETKNDVHFERPLPRHLTSYIDRYLQHYREFLIQQRIKGTALPTRALWLSFQGAKMSPKGIRRNIEARTEKAFGRKIWPHLFRDCAATSIAIEDPENLALGADLLANDFATFQRYYNQARMLETGRVYQRHMLELRQEAARHAARTGESHRRKDLHLGRRRASGSERFDQPD